MKRVFVQQEIDEETWTAEVRFDEWHRGPQYDEAPAIVTRDGERVEGTKWARADGIAANERREDALVTRGALWAPGVIGGKPNTAHAFLLLTAAVHRAVVAHEQEAA